MLVAAAEDIGTVLREARRNVLLLTVAQALLGVIGPISFAVGGVAGHQLLGDDKSLATAPLTAFNVGMALGVILVAILSRMIERRFAFMIGAVIAAIGGIVTAAALFRESFWLFATGLAMLGSSNGFTQKLRFAAADASPSFYKAKAISWILGGGILSAVLGPQIVIFAGDYFAPVWFAGAFVALIPICLCALFFFMPLRLPEARAAASVQAAPPARPLREIVGSQRFLTGMVCGISSYALMTFMMTGAPVAMVVGCGFSSDLATLGIQWHVLAMFAPSFATGWLMSRFGAERVVACGLLLLMGCAAVAHLGIELWNFWGALVLLGLGWNFGFIGATAIVAQSYRPHEADKVQGFHDVILFSTVAGSSFASGKVLASYGWDMLNAVIWPVAGLCLVLLFLLMRASKRAPA
ncbi:MFS transporter [Sinorhizobium americanum]|uniref:MFS-type transporter YdeG n=1 Tax=Sinorhizobium americanum TaxID=194963 RepID=A0A1L3LKJ2_9HYPH|nr:MFS transporter [Sinorhizobium americanum]APG84050.1 MFS-type transporter YdeG [Sinorhizobium americanum CCGM7]APG90601.1 MFS-type transporter YdeG [Sinorhizobium americanum]OAP48065.1 MFS transporter [Sinorhizobium americanum]TCN30993.1 putative MFS family arabinose efflux permease [Sinorhizobium americanum]